MHKLVLVVVALLFAGPLSPAPDDLENAYQALKDAVAKQDAAIILKSAPEVCQLARKQAAEAAPEAEDAKAVWKQRVAYARDIEKYTEFALYSAAARKQGAEAVTFFATLEQLNPKSSYLGNGYGPYLVALNQAGQAAQIPALAQKAIANFPDDEDLLVFLADAAMNNRQRDRAGAHAERLIAVCNRHSRPEGVSAEEWDRKKTQALTRGYYIAGVVHSEKNQFYEAIPDLKAALPLVKGTPALLAPTLFYLGLANYHVGRQTMNRAQVLAGADYSEQAAKLSSPLQQQAWTNAHLMRTEAQRMALRK